MVASIRGGKKVLAPRTRRRRFLFRSVSRLMVVLYQSVPVGGGLSESRINGHRGRFSQCETHCSDDWELITFVETSTAIHPTTPLRM